MHRKSQQFSISTTSIDKNCLKMERQRRYIGRGRGRGRGGPSGNEETLMSKHGHLP